MQRPWRVPVLAIIIALSVASGVDGPIVAQSGTPEASGGPDVRAAEPWSHIRCVDVAASVGLDFVAAYGETVAGEDGGLVMQRNMGNGAAVGDYDRDGWLDVYLLGQAGHPNALYRNVEDAATGGRRFIEVGAEAGVADLGLGRVAHFADLDGDGWLDLMVLNDVDPEGRLAPSRIFRNDRDGTFIDVTRGSGFEPVGYLAGGATLADVDGDGDLDIYVAFWTQELGGTVPGEPIVGSTPGENRLYRNDGDFRFTDITRRSGLGGISRDTFTPVFHDFDGDGDLDLYVPVDHREDLYYENRGGRFRDRSRAVGVDHVGNDMGVALADVNGDGLLDLFVTNINDPEENFGKKPRGNTLLLSEVRRGRLAFTDVAYDYGVLDTAWGWGTAFVDIDLDGRLDLFAVQGFDEFVDIYSKSLRDARSVLFWNDGGMPFVRTEGAGCDVEGDQRALVAFDYDRDGDVDLLISQVDLPVILLENRSDGGRSLTVKLDDRSGWGAGARIDVTVAGHTTSQLVMHGGSYLAGTPLEAVFGLGDAERADRVRVTDVRGKRVLLRDVEADQMIRVSPGR
ncbi:CRTAC1 family protein [soil metagenome]